MNKVIIFTLGAAVGSLLTWKLVEKKYKQIADEEIASVKETFRNREKEEWKIVDNYIETDELDNTKMEYTKQINNLGYTKTDRDYIVEVEQGEELIEPYIISPEEYGEKEGFESVSWTCYADYILADDDRQVVSDPENIIGDALSHFGEYADDAVYVRNENTECDYEILKHEKAFSEVIKVGR